MEASFAVGAIQMVAVSAAVWLSGRRRLLDGGLPYLVSVAVGVLLATALLHILPEAVSSLGNRPALWFSFLGTLFVLFCIEHIFSASMRGSFTKDTSSSADVHAHRASRPLGLVFGGLLHSFVDGLSVAVAFTAGRRFGWATAAAITLHEVPHRMGDYALLTHLRVAKRSAMQLIVLIGIAALAGVFLVAVVGHAFAAAKWLLPISAASFLYIAMVGLMPELAGTRLLGTACLQLLCMLAGACIVFGLLQLPIQ